MNSKKVVLLTLVPIIITGVYVLRFGLNIPFLDQWEVTPLLARRYEGTLSLGDLFAQHNEHRPFFPRLVWIGLAEFTHYNVNVELWVNFLTALGTFYFFVNRSLRTWRVLSISTPPWMIPLMSLLVFNLGQRESWLQGFQTVAFLGTAAVVIGLFLLADNLDWMPFLGALGLGIIATFSMASGLLYWCVGLAILAITLPRKLRAGRLLTWIVVSTISMALFFWDWTSSASLNWETAFAHPLAWYFWILSFLGAPLMTSWYVAWIFGAISAGLFILVLGQLIRTGQWHHVVPYAAVALFIVATAFSISFGRMDLGMPQAVVPRYLTWSVWYWMSLLALLPSLALKGASQRLLYSLLTTSLLVLTVIGGWRGTVSIYSRILPAYRAVASGQEVSDSALARIYPEPAVARARLAFLCAHRLSACASAP